MPYKDKAAQRAYQRRWQTKRNLTRQAKGQCVQCGKRSTVWLCRRCQDSKNAWQRRRVNLGIKPKDYDKALLDAAVDLVLMTQGNYRHSHRGPRGTFKKCAKSVQRPRGSKP